MLGYLDPATGSMLLQALVAFVAGVAVFAKFWWWRIKRFFRADPSTPQEADDSHV